MSAKAAQCEIQGKLRILRHADTSGSAIMTCRYFGVGRSSFYRWRDAYSKRGENGLINSPLTPKQQYNRTLPEIEEKVLHLEKNLQNQNWNKGG